MQRTMIALRGPGNAGKSTTIRLVYQNLRREGRVIRPVAPLRKEVKGAILEINGVEVGITSQGDEGEIVRSHVERLIEAGCVVIVCATRTYGGTVDVIEQLASEADLPFDIVWIEKDRQAHHDHDAGNRQKADEVIAEVKKAVVAYKRQVAELLFA